MLSFLVPIKEYLATGAMAVIAIFIFVFKYRGTKIKGLKETVQRKNNVIEVTTKVVEAEKKAAQYVADNRVAKVYAEDEVEEDNHKYAPDTSFYI